VSAFRCIELVNGENSCLRTFCGRKDSGEGRNVSTGLGLSLVLYIGM